MSHIQSKIARRAVRQIGKHPRELKLTSGATYLESLAGAGPFSSWRQRHLLPTCGRAIYRALKKATRKGLVPAL